jgi:hypothetical protein
MSAKLKSVERAQRKLVRLQQQNARSRAINRQIARVVQRAFVVIERNKRIAKLEERAREEGTPLALLPPRPTREELVRAKTIKRAAEIARVR